MGKRKMSFFMVLLLVLLAGCTEAAVPDPVSLVEEDALFENEWGVALTVQDVTPTGLTIVCERSDGSDAEISTNPVFKIYMQQDEVWVPYERADGEFGYKAWDQVFYEVAVGEPLILEADWTWLHGELPAGEYLVMKRFFAEEPRISQKDPEIFFAFAKFVIEA